MSRDLSSFSSSIGRSRHHISFITKYRHKIFGFGRIKTICEKSFYETAEKYGFKIIELGFDIGHLHMVVEIPPKYSVSQMMKFFKGRSSRKLFQCFPWLREKFFWGGKLWSPSYFFDSMGDVSSEVIERYVREQGMKGDQKRLTEYFPS